MKLELHLPTDGFYQGTRFDRSGIFRSLQFRGTELCGPWFQRYDPFMHDAVKGPAEEFSPVLLDGLWLKPGVGLLMPDSQPYDRFKLYPLADPGRWETDGSRFNHYLEGCYDYVKEIAVTGESSFEIRHTLKAFVDLQGSVYNHNFFTMGKMAVTPSRLIDFPFRPEGGWRARYDSVAFTPCGVRFSRALVEGESVYCGNIHEAAGEGMPYTMRLSEGPLSVTIKGDVPVQKTVLWANHRIACLEPYNSIDLGAGQTFCWKIEYTLENNPVLP
ncbi:MAG: hypothetical protein J6Y31_00660 [Bacteroidales bacterium]|nr:hypothetical protein [Bacteroidales bacterium]